MDKRLRRLLCMLLGLALLLGSVGTASAAGKRNNRLEIDDLGDRMDDWYYVSSTVPKEYLNQEKTELRIATNDGSDYNPEYAQTCEITFKKGDEALKDALVATQEGDRWYAYVDNGALTAPGKAVFHFKAESESYVYERDFTINVLDWNEHPLLKVVNDHPVIEAKVGQQITDDQVMAAVGELYTADIFDNVLKLKARSWMASDYFIPRSNSDVVFEGDKLSRVYEPSFLISRYNTQVNDYGENEAEFVYTKGNIRVAVPVVFSVRGYVLSGDQSPEPGGTVQFSVTGSTEGRTFTWSVEGEGASAVTKWRDLGEDYAFDIDGTSTSPKIKFAVSDDGKKIILSGFDYPAMFCGLDPDSEHANNTRQIEADDPNFDYDEANRVRRQNQTYQIAMRAHSVMPTGFRG